MFKIGPHGTGPHGTGPHGTGPHGTGPKFSGTGPLRDPPVTPRLATGYGEPRPWPREAGAAAEGSMGRKGAWGEREYGAEGRLRWKGVWGGGEYGALGTPPHTILHLHPQATTFLSPPGGIYLILIRHWEVTARVQKDFLSFSRVFWIFCLLFLIFLLTWREHFGLLGASVEVVRGRASTYGSHNRTLSGPVRP